MRRQVVLVIGMLMLVACGGDAAPSTTAATTATTSSEASPTTLPPTTVVAPTDGLPDNYPPELLPPGATSSYWEPTGAGTDVFFETTAGFDELIDFFTSALEPPLDVRTEEGVDRAIWVYKPGVEHITVILESDAEGIQLKVSGLF